MSSQAISAPVREAAPPAAWPMWRRQTLVILREELRKNFLTRRGFWIYLLALAPVALVWLHTFVSLTRFDDRHPFSTDTRVLAGIFLLFYLRLGVFFGCMGIFSYLFRGEVLEKSLHYYFLSPVRREVLLAGKFLAGLVTACFFFGVSVALTFAGMYAHYHWLLVTQFLFEGAGLQHLLAYLGVTMLACLGYGSVFLALGLLFKNPILPAWLFMFWESMNLFLPSWLKKVSVFHYLKSLTPVDVPLEGPGLLLAVVGDPTPPWLAVLGLLAFTAAVLLLAARLLRRMEISYSTD